MSENKEKTNENAGAVDVRSPEEVAGAVLSKEARLCARVSDPGTRTVFEKLATALKNPETVKRIIAAIF